MGGPDRIEEVSRFGLAAEGSSGTPQFRKVPRSADITWSSFDCSGASMESNVRCNNGNMIAERDTTVTAITFHGTVDFGCGGSTKVGVSENSYGLVKKFAGVNQECSEEDSDSSAADLPDLGADCDSDGEGAHDS